MLAIAGGIWVISGPALLAIGMLIRRAIRGY